MTKAFELTLDGKDYAILTREEYVRLTHLESMLMAVQVHPTGKLAPKFVNILDGKPTRKPRKAKAAIAIVVHGAAKKRGRKPKVIAAAAPATPVKAKRGRKPKAAAGGAGNIVKQARKNAGLTQAALAKKLGTSQPAVSLAEAANGSVDPAFVESVLKACELPSGWQPSA